MESPSSKSWDVFVVGGGPAGLATAIAARRRGLSVLLADGAIPPIDKSCGEGLMPEGVRALHNLGISIPDAESYPFRGIHFVSGVTRAEAELPRGSACGIRRTILHRLLVEHASVCGVHMMWQTAVTGLHTEGVLVAGALIRARWVVGADGTNSRVRRWANLDGQKLSPPRHRSLRFGFRRRYRLAPWSDFMELHWGRSCQLYVTPISREEICVAMISSSPKLRVEDALQEFPELCKRLEKAELTSSQRGAITITRKLRNVYRGRTALVGDASGGVDAITGEGLCLAFRQATLLGDCLAEGSLAEGSLAERSLAERSPAERSLARYQQRHRALLRRPALIARMMLLMADHRYLRQRTMQVFQSNPRSFAGMLALHVGEGSPRDHISNGLALGWQLLKA